MTNKQLIAKLKKLPQNAQIAWRDHDQRESELNGFVHCVNLVNFSDIQPNMFDLNEEIIVLS